MVFPISTRSLDSKILLQPVSMEVCPSSAWKLGSLVLEENYVRDGHPGDNVTALEPIYLLVSLLKSGRVGYPKKIVFDREEFPRLLLAVRALWKDHETIQESKAHRVSLHGQLF